MAAEENILKKILIVNDESLSLDNLSAGLKAKGYMVSSAFTGLEALDKAALENPDMIIMDVMIAQVDGYRICRMLKYDDRYEHIPIILISARPEPENIDAGLEAGADMCIKKPFETNLLLEDIGRILTHKKSKT